MTEKEKASLLNIALDFNFLTNYISVLAKRETDEREEIIASCETLKKRIKELTELL